MTGIDIALTAYAVFTSIAIFFAVRYNRDLSVKNEKSESKANDWKYAFEKEKEQVQHVLNKNMELDKKAKMSDDVIAVMNDLKQGGTILEITRLDRNDIFFHNGGLYR